MWVTILAREYEKYPEYYGATLWMPATRAALQDAMEQVRVPGGGSCRLTRLDGWPKFLAERLSRMEADIQEVNVLAGKIDQIGRESIPWYEGVIGCVESERGAILYGRKDSRAFKGAGRSIFRVGFCGLKGADKFKIAAGGCGSA